ncbi:MAG: porin [Deltaproteobacteria bacterium]|nr:porin [Deltaproteobacteria bacterium]
MKKLLALALGAMLWTVLACPAEAQENVKISGWYRVLHHNLVNFNRAAVGDYVQSDSFFENRLNVNFDFTPTEDILIHWTLRAPNYHRWGATTGQQGSTNAYQVWTRAIYATIKQDWGSLSIGRLEQEFPTSMNGLKTLGYSYGTTYVYANPFDFKQVADGISYTYNMDNGFGVNVYYAKYATQDPDNSVANGTNEKDVDFDRFGVEPTYKWDGGAASLNIEYARDMRDGNAAALNRPGYYANTKTDKDYAFFINPAIMQSWGDFSIRFEGKIGWGETTLRSTIDNKRDKVKREGLGLYLQATYKYGAGDINLMGWFADGSSLDERGFPYKRTQHDLVGMGDFAPFLVAYYENNLGNRVSRLPGGNNLYDNSIYGSPATRGRLGTRTVGTATGTNHWGLGLLGNHNFSDAIRLNWGIGYFRLVEEDFLGQNKNLGVEVDLGIRIRLLQGVTFESQFGYMFNGDAWESNGSGDGSRANPYRDLRDAKDTYAWLNALQFAF